MKNNIEKALYTIDGYPNYVLTSFDNIYRKPYVDGSGNFRVLKLIQKRIDGRFILIDPMGKKSCFSIDKMKQTGLLTKISPAMDIESLSIYKK